MPGIEKISGPLLDRIDIQIHVPRLQYQEMKSTRKEESSAAIRQRVVAARKLQRDRLKGTHLFCNASMGRREVKAFCPMTREAECLLEKYFISLGLSARSHDRIIKVARPLPIWEEAGKSRLSTWERPSSCGPASRAEGGVPW